MQILPSDEPGEIAALVSLRRNDVLTGLSPAGCAGSRQQRM